MYNVLYYWYYYKSVKFPKQWDFPAVLPYRYLHVLQWLLLSGHYCLEQVLYASVSYPAYVMICIFPTQQPIAQLLASTKRLTVHVSWCIACSISKQHTSYSNIMLRVPAYHLKLLTRNDVSLSSSTSKWVEQRSLESLLPWSKRHSLPLQRRKDLQMGRMWMIIMNCTASSSAVSLELTCIWSLR